MTSNEIKKLLYKQNPTAQFSYLRKGIAYYYASITIEKETVDQYQTITFEIPIADMGDADFHSTMEAKYLIRWILITEEQPT